MFEYCQRCGRKLTSQESMDRIIDGKKGWGKTCYRIYTNTQKLQENDDLADQIQTIKTENSFMKMEITKLQIQLREIQSNGQKFVSREVPIERIKREERRVEQTPMVGQMVEVMNTLREKFKIMHKAMGDIRSILEKPQNYEAKEFVSLAELKRKNNKKPIEIIEVR